jgi:Fibronectin type III domain
VLLLLGLGNVAGVHGASTPPPPGLVPTALPAVGSASYTIAGEVITEPTHLGIPNATVDLYSVQSCDSYSFPTPARCGLANSTLTNASGVFSLNTTNGSYYLVAQNSSDWGGAWFELTVNGAGFSHLSLRVYPYLTYGNDSFDLPDWNNLTAYAFNCNADASPLCHGSPSGTQVPLMSWTSDGVYYVNASNELVFANLANSSVLPIGPWDPLYDNIMSYQGIENTEWITSDGAYVYEVGCASTCHSTTPVAFYALNVTTGANFSHTFATTQSQTLQNGQFNLIGMDGNDSDAVLVQANGQVNAYNLWNRTAWTLGTLPYFEANNLYWVPFLDSFLDIQADGATGDRVDQYRLVGSGAGSSLAHVFGGLDASGFTVNGVDGIQANLTDHTLAFEIADTPREFDTCVFGWNSSGVLTRELSLDAGNPGEGTWPNDTVIPTIASSEHRIGESSVGPYYANTWDGYFDNVTPFYDWSTQEYYASNVTPFILGVNATQEKEDGVNPSDVEQLGFNSSYFMGGADCRHNGSSCAVRGNAGSALGTVYYYWRMGLPKFPYPAGAPLAEVVGPAAPSLLTASANRTAIRVTWSPPVSGTDPILNYTLWWGAAPNANNSTSLTAMNRSFTIDALLPGTAYHYEVRAMNLHGYGLAALGSITTSNGPQPPTHLAISARGFASIGLSWTNPNGTLLNDSIAYGYSCQSLGAPSSLGNVSRTTIGGLTQSTTYCFEVTAWNASGPSTPSIPILGRTLGVPTAPTDLALVGRGVRSLTLSWANPPGTLTNDSIAYGPDCAELGGAVSLGVTTITTLANLVENATYCVEVTAWNSSGPSDPSAPFLATTSSLPMPPTDLGVVSLGDDYVTLRWVNPVGLLVNDSVRYGTSCGRPLANLSIGVATEAVVGGLLPRTSYCFSVTAWNATGPSPASDPIVVATGGPPPAPTNLTVVAVSQTSAELEWTNPAGPLLNDTLYYGRTCPSGSGSGGVSLGIRNSTLVTGLSPDTVYCFGIIAWNTSGASPLSHYASILTATVPAAPSGLIAMVEGATSIDLNWTNPSSGGIVNDSVYVGPHCGNWTLEESTDGPVSNYTVVGLVPSTAYCLSVAAWNATGESPVAAGVAATTIALLPPDPPTYLTVDGVTSGSVRLNWTNPTTGVTLDQVLYGTSCHAFTNVWNSSTPSEAATIGGLSAGTTYCFEVEAIGAGGPSSASNPISAETSSGSTGGVFGPTPYLSLPFLLGVLLVQIGLVVLVLRRPKIVIYGWVPCVVGIALVALAFV